MKSMIMRQLNNFNYIKISLIGIENSHYKINVMLNKNKMTILISLSENKFSF